MKTAIGPGIVIAAVLVVVIIYFGGRFLDIGGSMIVADATVTDGDTIRMGQNRIRLYGIDAPEKGQTCTDAMGQAWYCGDSATEALRSLIDGAQIECKQKDTDQYDRIVAVCYRDEIDINAWMVRNGWAVAYRRYSRRYVDEEAKAKRDGLGIWAGEFESPANWRRRQRPISTQSSRPPPGEDVDCGDFPTWEQAQAFFENAGPGDPHRLDGDGDGIACEALRNWGF